MKTELTVLAAVPTGFGQPSIATQPQHQTNAVGTTATFWDVATGTPTLATGIPGQPGTTSYTDTNAAKLEPLFYRVGVEP